MKMKTEYILKNIGGENILMLLSKEHERKIITLNETALFIFNLIAEGKDRDAIIASLLAEYETDEKTITGDVDSFIKILKDADILEDLDE